jgi:RimJ/RimL family protein N-acetyltransferase
MSVVIQRIRTKDIAGFRDVYDAVARERKYLAALEGHSLERTKAFVENNIAMGFPQFVALCDGRVIGWCDIIPMSLSSHAHSATLGMGLLAEYRGRGFGRALIEASLNDARRLGLVRVELTVHADNVRAIALYERVGFKVEGIKKDAVLIDSEYKDIVMMALVDRSGREMPPDA